MFYQIVAIVIGTLLFISSILFIVSNQKNKAHYIVSFISSLGLIGSGIGGFFMPDNIDYVTIILLLFFCALYLVTYGLVLKHGKKSQQQKDTPKQKKF